MSLKELLSATREKISNDPHFFNQDFQAFRESREAGEAFVAGHTNVREGAEITKSSFFQKDVRIPHVDLVLNVGLPLKNAALDREIQDARRMFGNSGLFSRNAATYGVHWDPHSFQKEESLHGLWTDYMSASTFAFEPDPTIPRIASRMLPKVDGTYHSVHLGSKLMTNTLHISGQYEEITEELLGVLQPQVVEVYLDVEDASKVCVDLGARAWTRATKRTSYKVGGMDLDQRPGTSIRIPVKELERLSKMLGKPLMPRSAFCDDPQKQVTGIEGYVRAYSNPLSWFRGQRLADLQSLVLVAGDFTPLLPYGAPLVHEGNVDPLLKKELSILERKLLTGVNGNLNQRQSELGTLKQILYSLVEVCFDRTFIDAWDNTLLSDHLSEGTLRMDLLKRVGYQPNRTFDDNTLPNGVCEDHMHLLECVKQLHERDPHLLREAYRNLYPIIKAPVLSPVTIFASSGNLDSKFPSKASLHSITVKGPENTAFGLAENKEQESTGASLYVPLTVADHPVIDLYESALRRVGITFTKPT